MHLMIRKNVNHLFSCFDLGENESIETRLSKSLIECILVELIPMLPIRPHGTFDWLSKEVTVRLVKIILVDPLSNVCQGIIQLLDGDDKWKHYLVSARKYIFPDVVSCENKKCDTDEKRSSICLQNSSFEDIFQTDQQKSFIQGKMIKLAFIITFLQVNKSSKNLFSLSPQKMMQG